MIHLLSSMDIPVPWASKYRSNRSLLVFVDFCFAKFLPKSWHRAPRFWSNRPLEKNWYHTKLTPWKLRDFVKIDGWKMTFLFKWSLLSIGMFVFFWCIFRDPFSYLAKRGVPVSCAPGVNPFPRQGRAEVDGGFGWSKKKRVVIGCLMVGKPPVSTTYFGCTPPKTNMEPENEPLEEEIPMKNHHF